MKKGKVENLTELQLDILEKILNEIPVVAISKYKSCSKQAVYKVINILKSKGFLSCDVAGQKRNLYVTQKGKKILFKCNKIKEVPSMNHCEICGCNHIIHYHHIDENNKNNHYSNLICLCPNHHYLIHKGKARLDFKEGELHYIIKLNKGKKYSI